ncbi:ankyrin repeat domain-containing protein [Paenibacillus sp. R14(2021)]|uniref:ankyrin repeat domain-containing protein n=1 Tax=Paenibacillus sp. R14(2021) TaxID=2859228 RepID=UPI001C613429|nr:ankyrin repeat domain-containing protein [Paenibacillus sp. R14(2021)]
MNENKWDDLLASLNEQEKAVIKEITQAIRDDQAASAAQLFHTHAWLASFVNVPCFAFDSPAIVVAASRGSREMVDVLLANGADINAKSQWWAGGFGVLHNDQRDLAPYLIERGAQVDTHAAAALDMMDLLSEMVEADPAVVNLRGPDGQVPLHFAKERRIIDFLLTHGADIDRRDIDHGSTPAQWAVDDPDKCRYLIERGAETDIFIACILNDVEAVSRLLASDPDVLNAQVGQGVFTSGDSDGGHIYLYKIGAGTRPLFLAQRLQRDEILALMLRYSSTEQQFLLACYQADTAAVHAIAAEHPNLAASLQPVDASVIVDAADDRRLDAVRIMLEVGFPVDARRRPQSATALHMAASQGNLEIVALLLQHGASVHAINEFGGTPLGSCIWGSQHLRHPAGDYAAVTRNLIEAGAKLPDHVMGSEEVKTVLIAHGVRD